MKIYSVKIYERQEWMYRYDVEAVDETIAKDIAIQLHVDGEQSDDSDVIDSYTVGTEVVDGEHND